MLSQALGTGFVRLDKYLRKLDWRWGLAFGLPFALYCRTLAPTVYNLDSAELTTAAATGGLVHPTGYPLYLLLGRAWSLLPVGDIGYRMNLFSAFNGALTLFLAALVLRRVNVSGWAALGALGLLACAPAFWGLSSIAEVYTLHTAWMALILLLLLHWKARPGALALGCLGLSLGLSAANHASTILLVPGCIWFVLAAAPRAALQPRSLAAGLLGLALGLSLYLYLPLAYAAGPAFNYAGFYDSRGVFRAVDLHSLAGFWRYVTGSSFSGMMFAYHGAALWRQAGQFALQLGQAFFLFGVLPGLLGLFTWLREDWRLAGALLLFFTFNAVFYISYRVIDKELMFLPTYLVWALWLAYGYQKLLTWLGEAFSPHPLTHLPIEENSRQILWPLRVLILLPVCLSLAWNWRLNDLSQDWSSRRRAEAILDIVEPGAVVIGGWDTAPVLQYLQIIEGRRPDITVINRFLITPTALANFLRREVSARPVYIDMLIDGIQEWNHLQPAGPLYRLKPRQKMGLCLPLHFQNIEKI